MMPRVGDVDIRLLRVYRTVAKCGGFAASEFELNIGRSTISRQIADLESRVSMKLCDRGPGGFSLTQDGKVVLAAADKLFDAIAAFQSTVDDVHENLRGALRFAFFDLAAGNPQANLQSAFSSFAQQAPQVSIELATEPPNVIEAGVLSGRYDIGVIPLFRRSEELAYYGLYRETMVMYCSHLHPIYDLGCETIAIKTLSKYKYAGFDFNSPNMFAGQKHHLNLAAKVRNEEALKVLILSGEFLGFLPDHVAAPFVNKQELKAVAIKQTSYQTSLAAVVRRRPKIDRKTQEFLRCLKFAHSHNTNTTTGLTETV